jgi:N-acetylglucosaminyldiphosphoundecaprenol N-acetyl-beta-D-mannosaminyltransferase
MSEMSPLPPPVQILGVPVHPITVEDLHKQLGTMIETGGHELVLHVNVHGLNLAHRHSWLRDFLASARIVFCDGAGVILGARLLGKTIPSRITYADWMWELAEYTSARGYKLYFLGGREGVAERAAARLRDRFPAFTVVGHHHGYFDRTAGSSDNEAVLAAINAARPDIILVAFGMPLQERWLLENWDRIEAHVALTAGAAFDYVSGDLRRAPPWMRKTGMEWLGRLVIEPRRLAGRYILGNPLFLARVMKERLTQSVD